MPRLYTFHCVQNKTNFILKVLNHLLKREYMFNGGGKQANAVYEHVQWQLVSIALWLWCESVALVEAENRGITCLVTDQHVDASGSLFEDLIYLSGWDVEELSDLLCQLSSCELLQVNGVIYWMKKASTKTKIKNIHLLFRDSKICT